MALSLHSAATAHLTCTYALRVMVIIPRRSEWWRSATLTAGPCVSLPLNRQVQTSCLVGLGRSPVRGKGSHWGVTRPRRRSSWWWLSVLSVLVAGGGLVLLAQDGTPWQVVVTGPLGSSAVS